MGDATMNVTDIFQKLKENGDPISSSADVNKALIASEILVDGVKVKRFTRAARGRYRVAVSDPPSRIEPLTPPRREATKTPRTGTNGISSKQLTADRDADREVLRRLIRKLGTYEALLLAAEVDNE